VSTTHSTSSLFPLVLNLRLLEHALLVLPTFHYHARAAKLCQRFPSQLSPVRTNILLVRSQPSSVPELLCRFVAFVMR
ncbi:hypothetical protein B9Z19DRAFT_975081, partial [Tuber borchii]